MIGLELKVGFGLGAFSMLNTPTATAPLPRGTKCLFGLQRRGTKYHRIALLAARAASLVILVCVYGTNWIAYRFPWL